MDLRPQITVRSKKTGEKKVYRLDQDRATIGRDSGIHLANRPMNRRRDSHSRIARMTGSTIAPRERST